MRFSNEKAVFDAVYYSAKSAITADTSRPQVSFKPKKEIELLLKSTPDVKQTKIEEIINEILPEPKVHVKENIISASEKEDYFKTYELNSTLESKYTSESEEIDLSIKTALPVEDNKSDVINKSVDANNQIDAQVITKENKEVNNFKYLGEAFKTYIFAEYNGKLIIIDKHAAHERMLYNKLKKDNGSNGSQLLLQSVSVTLSKEEYVCVTENLDLLNEAGFDIDDFGNGSVIVRACPLNLEREDVTALVSEIASYLVNNKRDITPDKLDWVYHSMACRAAIKAGNKSTDYELIEFTKQLLADDSIRYCPHGRPVLVELTKYEIDKQFGRV